VALHRENRIRVMAITTEVRHPSAPEIPTFKEQGFPMMSASNWTAIFASAKTPEAIVQKLSREAYRAVNDPAIRERFVKMGLDPMEMTPPAFASYVAKDIAVWQEDARKSGVKLD
jgi:tripartite-type tricarboxylate transporter receptor subunit TctC